MEIFRRTDIIRAAAIGEFSYLIVLMSAYFSTGIKTFTPLGIYIMAVLLVVAPLGAIGLLYAAKVGSKYIPSAVQLMKFTLVGVFNTLVDLGAFTILALFFGTTTYIVLSAIKTISFFIALTNSYVWNKYWVFRESSKKRNNTFKEFTTFLSVSVGGLIVNILAFSAAIYVFEKFSLVPTNFALIIAVLFASLGSMFWNFTGYKFLVFKK